MKQDKYDKQYISKTKIKKGKGIKGKGKSKQG